MNTSDSRAFYQIKVKGRLDQSRSSWFDNLALTFEKGETTISGEVADQAAQSLKDCALQAPMDGYVLKRNIEVGTLASPTPAP